MPPGQARSRLASPLLRRYLPRRPPVPQRRTTVALYPQGRRPPSGCRFPRGRARPTRPSEPGGWSQCAPPGSRGPVRFCSSGAGGAGGSSAVCTISVGGFPPWAGTVRCSHLDCSAPTPAPRVGVSPRVRASVHAAGLPSGTASGCVAGPMPPAFSPPLAGPALRRLMSRDAPLSYLPLG